MMLLNWFYEIRSYINAYSQYIKFRWLISLIWVLAIAGMIWFYGDSLAFGTWRPLESRNTRLVVIGVVVAIWLVIFLWRLVRARRTDAKLIDAVTADGKPDPARAAAEDVAELRARLRDALKQLRSSLGRGSVYSLPWYALIGAPGAGKTTALTNSGLNFPLAETMGQAPLQGVAGTRHCDWWFTEDSILIDTAGRYTTQNNEQEVERASWQGFLALLKKHRPRQPLNGAIVMIGLDDIIKADPADRLRQARVIRKRLRELDEAFRLRLPAYIVLTKADRLAGFTAFFDNLDRSAREQVWGMTLPDTGREKTSLADLFSRGLDALVERLNGLLLDRLQAETDAQKRAEIFAFPSQIALLAEPLHEIMGEIGASSRFDPPPRIRGIYLASAQQDQASLDLVTRAASGQFGVDLPPLAESPEGGAKSFFLARLLRDVVFGEASLVSTDPVRERRRRIVRWTGAVAVGVIVAVCCGFWLFSYFDQERRLADLEARLALYSATARDIPVTDIHDTDFARVVPPLDQARAIVVSWDGGRRLPLALPDQGDKVRSAHHDLYSRALNDFLLPRLLVQVETDMKSTATNAAYVGDSIRLYPMLGGRSKVDQPFARTSLSADLDRVLPGDDKAGLRAALNRHIEALLAEPLIPIALDQSAIDTAMMAAQARERFAKWDAGGGQLCRTALEGHYPFQRAAASEVTAEDFTTLFAPNGRFDTFFRENLAPLADVTARPWRWKTTARQNGAAQAGLEAFERAAAIRDAFFGGPNRSLSVAFDVTPVGLDGSADSVVVTVDGQQIAYSKGDHGSPRPVALVWPNPSSTPGAAVSFQPAGPDTTIDHHGLWAPFRVLDTGKLQTSGSDRARVIFATGGRQATFDLHADTATNPFDLATLHDFHCPKTF